MALNLTRYVNKQHPLNRGRVAWWVAFRELTGRKYFVDICQKFDLTLTNSPSWSGVSPVARSGSLVTNGSSSYGVTSGATTALGTTGSMTASVWCKVPSGGAYQCIFSKGNQRGGGGADRFVIGVDFINNVYVQQTGAYANITLATLDTSTWHHLACTWNGTTFSGYYDGKLVSSTNPAGTVDNPSCEVTLGCGLNSANSPTEYVGASIDDASIWHRCLSADEILSIYVDSRRGYPSLLNYTLDDFIYSAGGSSFKPAWARGSNVLIRSMA